MNITNTTNDYDNISLCNCQMMNVILISLYLYYYLHYLVVYHFYV